MVAGGAADGVGIGANSDGEGSSGDAHAAGVTKLPAAAVASAW